MTIGVVIAGTALTALQNGRQTPKDLCGTSLRTTRVRGRVVLGKSDCIEMSTGQVREEVERPEYTPCRRRRHTSLEGLESAGHEPAENPRKQLELLRPQGILLKAWIPQRGSIGACVSHEPEW
jgi:hypothetical protein